MLKKLEVRSMDEVLEDAVKNSSPVGETKVVFKTVKKTIIEQKFDNGYVFRGGKMQDQFVGHMMECMHSLVSDPSVPCLMLAKYEGEYYVLSLVNG